MITEEMISGWYDEWLAIDIDIEPTSLAPSSVFYIANKAAEFEREECARIVGKAQVQCEDALLLLIDATDESDEDVRELKALAFKFEVLATRIRNRGEK